MMDCEFDDLQHEDQRENGDAGVNDAHRNFYRVHQCRTA